MKSLTKLGKIAPQPKFEEADNTSNHCCFTLLSRRKIDLDIILQNIRVDPNRNLFFLIQEDHILIDYEEAI